MDSMNALGDLGLGVMEENGWQIEVDHNAKLLTVNSGECVVLHEDNEIYLAGSMKEAQRDFPNAVVLYPNLTKLRKEANEKRDKKLREYMHSFKGTTLEGNTDIASAFLQGYTEGRRS